MRMILPRSHRSLRLPGLPGQARWSSLAGAVALVAVVSGAGVAGTETPTALINDLHDSLGDVMQKADELGYKGRYEKLAPVLESIFDLDFMGSKALGRHWKGLGPDDHKRWLEAFHRFTIANYAARFNGYAGESFKILGQEDASHDTIVVRTEIFSPDRDNDMTRLNYRLRETPGGWRVIDVYLNGSVSELALRRAEFSTAFERNGFDRVLASLESKIVDLSSDRGA